MPQENNAKQPNRKASRSSRRKAKYAAQFARTQRNKDRRVRRSSHGKYQTVAEMYLHREKVLAEKSKTAKKKRGPDV